MKRLCALLLLLIFLLPSGTMQAEGGAARLEGDGYLSPEDAVTAYLDAMNRGDVGGMLSTFAIETYVDHVDGLLMVRSAGAYTASRTDAIPVNNPFANAMMPYARYGGLATQLQQMYAAYSFDPINPVMLRSLDDLQDFENRFLQSPLGDLIGHVEFVEWINPVQLTQGMLLKTQVLRSMAQKAAYLNADDLVEVIAHIRVSSMDGLQFMLCAKYGDRWYNADFIVFSAMIMGISPMRQVLTLTQSPEEWQSLASQLSGNDYQDACSQWNATRNSTLAGTRWQLTKLTAPGYEVFADGEAAESSVEKGVWAEMHFLGCGGGLVIIRGSKAARQELAMNRGDAYVFCAWSEPDGSLAMADLKPMNKEDISISPDQITVEMKKDLFSLFGQPTITLQLDNGIQATFEKR